MELEWEHFHCTEKLNFLDAIDYLKTVKEDGWRLPTVDELLYACKNYEEGFQRWGYWSSDTEDHYKLIVYFYTANVWKMDLDSHMYVRFIRNIN